MALPGPFTPRGLPAHRLGRERFDDLVTAVIDALADRFEAEPEPLQIVIEEAPLLPEAWDEPVPTSTVRVPDGDQPRQVVVYRLPIITRAQSPAHVQEAVWAVMLHRLGEVWQISPDDLDPR